MMYGEEKSDSLIVAAKQANNPKGAESVERRSGAKGNAEQPHMRRTQSRESMSQRLSRVREAAKQRKKERFTALFHLLTVEALEAAFLSLSRKAAAGVDGIRWMDYAGNMKNNITDLHRRLHQGSYRAQPGRRHYIPKADGKQRPLGIASLEDKIVQYALVKILNAVYENDFMGFSYGFRPGRSQHDALDALATGLVRTNVNWVLDADISQFFDRVSHEWLIRFTEHRIGDRRVIRLIRKWLTAGTSEEGQWRATEESVAEARSNLGIPDISAQPGDIKYTARSTAPSGWLKANGEAVSRTIYAALFEAIGTTFGIGDGSTTFNLPDLRGEFIRGWDDGRGIDSGRGFGSEQPATSLSPYVGAVNGELIVGQTDVDGEGPYQNQYLKYALTTGTTQGVQFYTVRPRNIALLACIKY
ncbi:tail fiber protein [Klebsiella pneumoniae]|nr:tail fiber protein [Klebsiella pneumoniae]QRD11778.1 tail fiber protein [Klebsiella pneumoniae]